MKAVTISFVLVLLLVGLSVKSQTVPLTTGSKVSQEDAQAALDFHNKVRRDVGVSPLKWDSDLANYAQEWAEYLAVNNNCQLMHREYDRTKDLGENIFGGGGEEYNALDASQSWYSEINEYTFRVVTHQNYYNTGHYTQMIWKNTKNVGIGIAKCRDGSIIIVANYFPCGNVIGQKPY